MSTKSKSDVKTLKGQEGMFGGKHHISIKLSIPRTKAEDKVLEYLKKMNRPYGAVDVSANLKGAVSKAATQKILVALAEKGELVQKTYGKTTFFVANQAKIESLSAHEVASLEAEIKVVGDRNAALALEVKAHAAGLAKLRSAPTDTELASQVESTDTAISNALRRLGPLRSGTPVISPEEREHVHTEWLKWRAEWMRRRKVFMTFWQIVTDAVAPQEAESLAEELGIEWDSGEHAELERSAMCERKVTGILKRKRGDM
ncbi:hypothetical protein AX15_004244 [Amanita polypyramis BW_CC]|nr:hypothetical protein AX15_004244 [Amanita polypyramis BW_CC]